MKLRIYTLLHFFCSIYHIIYYSLFIIFIFLAKRSVRITHELREECKTFLSSLGYVCFTSEHHEAEALCANLVKNGKADGTISEGNLIYIQKYIT